MKLSSSVSTYISYGERELSEEYDQGAIDAAKRARDLIEEIVQRCDEAGIEYENSSFEEDFGVVDVVLRVLLPSGRKKREVLLWDVDDLEAFNDIEFEKYVIIGNYAAICRYDQGLIEAVFTIIDERPRPVRFMLRRILKAFGIDLKKDNTFDPRDLPQPDGVQKTAIRISPLSNELKVLTKSPSSYDISITINSKFSTHAEALKLLEKICHSVFFEVEIKNGIAPTLLRRRERRYNFKPLHELDGPAYPKYEYDQGPMSLYWYARSAINMPLLQFLAFYQTIEFYFPVYFKAEINRKVRSIIKDPSFKVERDADVSKLTLALSARAGGYGSEKEQLRATIRECVDQSQIECFLDQNAERAEFFTSKQKGLTQYSINRQNKVIDLINQVSDRIYDIRCKVVHVKSDDGDAELELLLPYTEEAEKLVFDIELVQFLAQKVLICSSMPIKL